MMYPLSNSYRDNSQQDDLNLLRWRMAELQRELELVREERDLYRDILENVPADIVAFTPDHRYKYINPMAVKNPVVRQWMIGKDDFEYCKGRNKPMELAEVRRKLFNEVVKEGVTKEWIEEVETSNGNKEFHLRRYFPKVSPNGGLEFMIGYALDVSKQVKAQNELMESRLAAERASRAKTEFLSKMTHEIRTPLNAIIGFGDILLQESPREDQLLFLQNMKHSGDALLGIVNDILDFSKIEAGHLELEDAPFSLQTVINQVAGAFQFRAGQKGLDMHLDLPASFPPVSGDSVKLSQVLLNLLGNAFKFTEAGYIKLGVEVLKEEGDTIPVCFTVEDSGIGISREKLPHIFESFTQADQNITRRFGGTGLGLTITKSLVELQGGSITVMSLLGKGTTFQLIIPYKKCQEEDCLEIQTTKDLDLSQFKLLVAEDNPMNQLVMAKMLERWNGKADMVDNGKKALEAMKTEEYDLVFMDLQMPVMDGLEAVKTWRSEGHNKALPIVALTADAFSEARNLVMEAGMDDFISKPLTKESLERVLARFLTKK